MKPIRPTHVSHSSTRESTSPGQEQTVPTKERGVLAGDGAWQYVPSRSPGMRDLERRAIRVAPSDETVLILGETGVGKDQLARLIHQSSPRRCRPFVHLNCASLSESLLESELFGHMRGSYTGASESRAGQFEMAAGGTIFLDEIGEIPARLQAKLLHVLQEKQVYRIGGRHSIRVDARILAATNRDLAQDIRSGAFRRDLFYRLGVVSLRIPPLRDRPEDLEHLARYFCTRYATLYNRSDLAHPEHELLAALKDRAWTGNIRELENVIKRVILLGRAGQLDLELAEISVDDLDTESAPTPPTPSSSPDVPRPLKEVTRLAVRKAEKKAILQSLKRTAWNRRKAARELRVSYRSLLYKIKNYTLGPDGEDGTGSPS